MGSPAVLVAVQTVQQHILVCVHLTEPQCFVGVITDHIMAVDQLLGFRIPILKDTKCKDRRHWWEP